MISKKDLEELYVEKNLTSEEISIYTGYAKSTIAQYLSKYKIKKDKTKNISRLNKSYFISDSELIKYNEDGYSASKVALLHNLHPCVIQRRYKKLGLKNEDRVKVGSIFGKLIVIKEVEKSIKYAKTDRMYLCKCICGNNKICRRSRLLRGDNTSCGCLMKSHLQNHGSPLAEIDISSMLWQRLKVNAKKRNIEFNITKHYILNLFFEQNQRCAISNILLKMPMRKDDRKRKDLASLDRIDNTKGYIKGNVRWILWEINRMKWDMSDEELHNMCKLILGINV